MNHRRTLEGICYFLNLWGIEPSRGVELGVYKGELSRLLLETYPELHLVMVDSWQQEKESRIPAGTTTFRTETQAKDAKNAATQSVMGFRGRVSIRHASTRLALVGESESIYDFIFVDAGHDFGNVFSDCHNWWPLVRPGGALLCHDYGKVNCPRHKEVTEAVNRFGQCVDRSVHTGMGFVAGIHKV